MITAFAPHSIKILGAPDRADAAADAAGQSLAATRPHELVVVADAHRRIEIDELHLGKLRELFNPAIQIVGRDGELLALNELDDLAAL